jgi:4'-phosphopantetheinyl transferase
MNSETVEATRQSHSAWQTGEWSGPGSWEAALVDPVDDWQMETCQCHVWGTSLRAETADFRRLYKTLSTEERRRAERFYFEKDRNHFIQCRSILRILLGRYLAVGPGEICLSASGRGKLYLTHPSNRLDLRFNLSHSNGMALFGFTRSHEVGVDIEYIQQLTDLSGIAANTLSAGEIAELSALTPEDQLIGFFNGWTRKEAILKATGEGIASGMNQIEVSLAPTTPCRIVSFQGKTVDCSKWSLYHLDSVPGFVGAVAVERPNMQFTYRTWQSNPHSAQSLARF